MSVIKVRNLEKTFVNGSIEVHAVNGVSLDFKEGEFTAIVGPSGSGKTTLLNMIGGLDEATKGEVFIKDTAIHDLGKDELIDFRLRNIGFVFQSYNLIPVLSAFENVEFTMLLQGRPVEERKKRVDHLLKSVGLEDKSKNKPSELSGGQQQRVAVARALAPKPAFVLADEPTANLDSISTSNLLDIMEKLNQEEHITFIFSTHDQRVIDRAKRVIYLEDGVVKTDEEINR